MRRAPGRVHSELAHLADLGCIFTADPPTSTSKVPIVGCALCIGCTIGIWCCIARRTRAPDRMAQTRPFAATATPVVKSDYKQETSLVVGMTAASKI